MRTQRPDRAGIQSIEVGVPLLAAFLQSTEAMTLTALAKDARMSTSKAHKYLASFVRAGLVTQDSRNSRYRLGPLALELGLTALRNITAVDISESVMLELRDQLGLTVTMTVWANQGPTIVRRVESHQLQFLMMRLGTVLPLLTSSNGRVFLAYLDRRFTQSLIDAELAVPDGPAANVGLHTINDVNQLIAKIHAERVAKIDGIITGLSGMSAPVFDVANTITAALTLVAKRDTNLSLVQPALIAAADGLSRQLGATCGPAGNAPVVRAAQRSFG
jgi:DNA-binding IclR family transcriptional regulator